MDLRQYEDHLRLQGLDPEQIDDLVAAEGDRRHDAERDAELLNDPLKD